MAFSWGENLRVHIFGQSHAAAIGVSIEGIPAGKRIDLEKLAAFLQRRAPGRNAWSTARRETDAPVILSGLESGVTCGAPLVTTFYNDDRRSGDYERLKTVPRPGHADYAAQLKYFGAQDVRGGGAFSGRMTAPLCAAGGVCLQLLSEIGVTVGAHALEIAGVRDTTFDPVTVDAETLRAPALADFPVLDEAAGAAMREAIAAAGGKGDSVGGVVECAAVGLPAGLGGALFGGLESRIAQLVFGIPAVKGVEFGAGFESARLRGSKNNDPYRVESGAVRIVSNNAGGILGGISTGMPLVFRAAFKPTPSIALPQQSVDLTTMENTELCVEGRHDPCIVPRAVPVVEAAAAIALYDAYLDRKKEL